MSDADQVETPGSGKVPAYVLVQRLVRARLRESWFRAELEDVVQAALRSDEVGKLLRDALSQAVNRAVTSHLQRPTMRTLIREVIREELREGADSPWVKQIGEYVETQGRGGGTR